MRAGESDGELVKSDPRPMDAIVAPYLEIDGVVAAALVSTEGLGVASAGGEDLDLEALAAYAASFMASAVDLAGELGTGLPSSLALDFPGRHLILAPVNEDLFLLLACERGGILAGPGR